jgi:glycosyltransferase involved in cell wall biosynthesis
LEESRRLEDFPRSYLFAGSDDVTVVLVRNDTSGQRTLRLNSNFRLLQIGIKRGSKLKTLVGLPTLARRIRQAARDRDVVVAYDPHVLGMLGWYSVLGRRTPFVVRVVCNYELKRVESLQSSTPFRSLRVERVLERILYRRADRVLVACENHCRYVRAVQPCSSIRHYVPAQVPAFYEEPKHCGIPRQHTVIAVSRLHGEKYAEDLVSLGARLAARSDIAFEVYGDGPLRAELEARAARIGSAVRFLGVRPQSEIRQAMEQAGAVVVLQGGGAIVEAALSGAPIVAYDFEMNPDVVSMERGEAWLVPFRDISALAGAVAACLDDPAEARRRGCRARRRALTTFGLERAREVEIAIRQDLEATP